MRPDTARSDLTDLFAATNIAIGGDWEVDGETWTECTSASGGNGAEFDYLTLRYDQPLPLPPKDLIAKVQALWKARGIEATTHVEPGEGTPMYFLSYPDFGTGTEPDGYYVQFNVSENFAAFGGTSHCAEGDAHALDLSEAARRASATPSASSGAR